MDSFAAIFDACVLYPATLRDFLLRLTVTDLFRARWTEQIHDEWTRSLLAQRPDVCPLRLQRTRERMNRHAEGCIVTDYESLVPTLTLPDDDDRHVLAAAIKCGASVIVTFNLNDFPTAALKPWGIEAQHPDDFVTHLIDLDSESVCDAVRRHRQVLTKPPFTVQEYLQMLRRQQLPLTAAELSYNAATL